MVKKLVERAEITRDDVVLDVGAGKGVIAVEASRRARLVYAVENDANMQRYLKKAAENFPNLIVVFGDALKLRLRNYTKIVSNPPFSILEAMIMRQLRRPIPMSLLVPKKFADNIVTQRTALQFKISLAYQAQSVELFEGDICEPPYRGRLCHLLLRPKNKTLAEEAMIDLLVQSTSKTRNALRNVLWKHVTKRTATRIVELSPFGDRVLEKPVRRTSHEELLELFSFLNTVFSDKNLRINHPSE